MRLHSNQEIHPIKESTYIKVFFVLVGLTILTLIQPSMINLQLGSTIAVQLFIALLKAILIIAYYMHIKSDANVFRTMIYGSLCVLAVIYILMAIDTYHRFTPNDFFQ